LSCHQPYHRNRPDLTETSITVPTGGLQGGKITITDTGQNNSLVAAPASTTSYYLSTDNTPSIHHQNNQNLVGLAVQG